MQQTLIGESIEKYYCIHCYWKGHNPKKETYMGGIITVCPECDWVAYSESEIDDSLISCYPILKSKIKVTI